MRNSGLRINGVVLTNKVVVLLPARLILIVLLVADAIESVACLGRMYHMYSSVECSYMLFLEKVHLAKSRVS